mgnify:CR=1 FL=1
MLKGIAASSGVAIAKVYKLVQPTVEIVKKDADPAVEVESFNKALEKTKADIEMIKERASARLSEEELAVFDAHLMMASDPDFAGQIIAMIENEKVNAEYAADCVSNQTVAMFEAMDNDYFRERAADVKDVTYRLKCNLLGLNIPDLSLMSEDSIVVAHDLTPSDTAQLNEYAKGFATAIGGRTSHSAIMARSLEVPAVVGCAGVLEAVNHGDMLILDALAGEVFVNPDAETIKKYEEKAKAYAEEKAALQILKDAKSITTDGHEVELAGNIGNAKDVEGVLNNGGEGVGLFRTEFLYMDADHFPTEDEQFAAYKEVLEGMGGRKVVVRTLDIGGDKKLSYFTFPEEMNPFLGYRAIRLCLDRTDIFRTQLRALLRASAYGNIGIMYPMIISVDEVKEIKKIVESIKAELTEKGIEYGEVEQGIMIETPAAVMISDLLAEEVDFFSIGTNDLTQYTLAIDRQNSKLDNIYDSHHPAVLRMIQKTIENGHKAGCWVGICGELGADMTLTETFLKMGIDELSVSPTFVLPIRKLIREMSTK